MPFVRISLSEELSPDAQQAVSQAVHTSLMQEFNIPADDYFQVIEPLKPTERRYPRSYLGIDHTEQILFIQIFAASGRTQGQKKRLYAEIARRIAASTSIPADDVIIILVENDGAVNWSFGQGEIQEMKHLKNEQSTS